MTTRPSRSSSGAGVYNGGPRCFDLRLSVEPQLATFSGCAKPKIIISVENAGPTVAANALVTGTPESEPSNYSYGPSYWWLGLFEPGDSRDISVTLPIPQADDVIDWNYSVIFDPYDWELDPSNNSMSGQTPVEACNVATLSIDWNNYYVYEGNSVMVTIRRGGNLRSRVSVDYRTESGTATVGSDFQHVTGRATLDPFVESYSFTVTTVQDGDYDEGSETAVAALSNPVADTGGAELGKSSDEINIRDRLNHRRSLQSRSAVRGQWRWLLHRHGGLRLVSRPASGGAA